MKSNFLKPIVGVLVLAATLISFSYIVTNGVQNETSYKESQTIKEVTKANSDLADQNNLLKAEKEKFVEDNTATQKQLSNLYDYINNKNTDLQAEYSKCEDLSIPANFQSLSDKDFLKYLNILYSKQPDIKKLMTDKLPINQKNFVQAKESDSTSITFFVGGVQIEQIKPECRSSMLSYKTVKLNTKTLKIDLVN